jgi:subtilisin family serine protease
VRLYFLQSGRSSHILPPLPRIQPLNYRSRGIQESATVGSSQQTSPYTSLPRSIRLLTSDSITDAGLTGAGVVVGIADTGLDENSCYFSDSTGRVSRSLPSAPIRDMNRRKVVQYTHLSSADTSDVTEGHGTHVCGTVAGNNQQNVYGGQLLPSHVYWLSLSSSPQTVESTMASLSEHESLFWTLVTRTMSCTAPLSPTSTLS